MRLRHVLAAGACLTGLAYHADAFMPGFFGVPAIRKHAMALADGRHGLLPPRAAVLMRTVCELRMHKDRAREDESKERAREDDQETGDGEAWIRSMNLDPSDDSVDEAAWMAAESSDSYCPMEGDLVEFIGDEPNSNIRLGMVVADSENKEVLVKALLTREGDGEYDEWKCYVGRVEKIEQVPLENVRYVGTCSECVEVGAALDALSIDQVE